METSGLSKRNPGPPWAVTEIGSPIKAILKMRTAFLVISAFSLNRGGLPLALTLPNEAMPVPKPKNQYLLTL
jgi:hypothetical protein